MKKFVSAKEAISLIKDDSSVMIGGFLSCGTPNKLIDELVNQNISGLTMISNDTSVPHADKKKLIATKKFAKS